MIWYTSFEPLNSALLKKIQSPGTLRHVDLWIIIDFREDNIKIDYQEVGWAGMDWIALAQDMDFRVP